MKNATYIQIGKVVKPHGVKGELKVKFDANLLPFIKTLNPLFFSIEKKYMPYFTTRLSLRDNGEAIAALEDVKTKEAGEEFINKPVFIEEKNIDEGYMDSDYTFLIGFSASNKNTILGVIDDIFNMPANKLARVMQGQKELLIPLHNNFIVKIIKSKKEIHFDLPDGLLDL